MDLDLKNKTVLFLAKRNSGKSVMMRYLLEKHENTYDKVFCICPTETINRFYSRLIPENCIMDAWSEHWVASLIKTLTEYKAKNNREMNVLLILDDCISDVRFHNSKAFSQLFSRGRHLFCSVWISSQHLYAIPPLARNNTDYVFSGMLSNKSKNMLCDEFAGSIDKEDFFELYDRATKDYSFLIINNNSVKDSKDLNSIYADRKSVV